MFQSHSEPGKHLTLGEEVQTTPDTMVGDRWSHADNVKVAILINWDSWILLLGYTIPVKMSPIYEK